MLKLIGKQGGQSMPSCDVNVALGPPGLLAIFSEIQGSRPKSQVPTFYVKVDCGRVWPIDASLQLEHSLASPLGSWA